MLNPESICRSPWKYDTAPFCITDNLYYVGNTSVSIHLFNTGEGLLLLDSSYPNTTYLLLESIRELGFSPKDIRWILHTHGHIDHFGATKMLVEKYGCKTYMPAIDVPFLNEKSNFNWCAELEIPYLPQYDTWFSVDREVHDGDVLTFGNTKVTAYSAAGHTPGTMAYVFDLPCGLRAAMHGGIGWNTLTSEYCIQNELGNTWREAYLESMDRLADLDVDIVLGNHPGQSQTFQKKSKLTENHNPFIDKTEWKDFILRTRNCAAKMFQNNPV